MFMDVDTEINVIEYWKKWPTSFEVADYPHFVITGDQKVEYNNFKNSFFLIGTRQLDFEKVNSYYFNLKQIKVNQAQQELLTKQTNIQDNQTKILKATFGVYFLMAIIMLFQIVIDYFYRSVENASAINIKIGSLILISAIIFFMFARTFDIKLDTKSKLNIVLMVLLVILVIILAAVDIFSI